MADWVTPDVYTFMPPALSAAFLLLPQASREAELDLIVAGAVSDFRAATLAGSDSAGSLDSGTVPVACLRHVAAIAWYTLAGEIGVDQTNLRPAWQDAEIYLRQIMRDLATAGAAVSGASGTPLYSAGRGASSPFSSGSSAAADGRSAAGGGGSGMIINYLPNPAPVMV